MQRATTGLPIGGRGWLVGHSPIQSLLISNLLGRLSEKNRIYDWENGIRCDKLERIENQNHDARSIDEDGSRTCRR
jgi:hypothetical protein